MSSSPLYEIDLTMNDGSGGSFGDYRGKPVLVVNVASKCGFTPQYAGLEELYGKYAERGLVVLGMPCNQFMGQEPGNDADIAEFCSTTFGVSFPLLAKGDVRGKDQHPLYGELTQFKNGVLPGLVKWNFEKFLVGRDGKVMARFAPTVEPDAPEVIAAIEQALEAPAG
ncbi:glutathione peroxidase [Arthrobacter sp. RIT-PI-e]|uniref:glutathione peroxidase n=1 Tax=Arthrobacter sp. RIT-PI-e TaxID=1681197 RepID=UPI000675ECE2|nr:glutathione peroxidase [Arthrobacter sp. RIT-PI-e]KNC19342.1 glutathione peroxidase [Arthrobacter sp. RIT-PI-e]